MAQYRRPKNNRLPPRGPSDTRTLRRLPDPSERRAPVVYGKPFMLMEDAEKNTYIYEGATGCCIPPRSPSASKPAS